MGKFRRAFWRWVDDMESNLGDAVASGLRLFKLIQRERKGQAWVVAVRNEVRRQKKAGTIWKVKPGEFVSNRVTAFAWHNQSIWHKVEAKDSETLVYRGHVYRRAS